MVLLVTGQEGVGLGLCSGGYPIVRVSDEECATLRRRLPRSRPESVDTALSTEHDASSVAVAKPLDGVASLVHGKRPTLRLGESASSAAEVHHLRDAP